MAQARMFRVEEEWVTFNNALSQQTLAAASELRQIYFPDNIWNTPQNPADANQRVKNHGNGNLTAHFFLRAINEAEKAAQAIPRWLLDVNTIEDYEMSRLALQRIANEQFLRERNLLETLLPLIRFSDLAIPQDRYIEHYSAYREYEYMHKKRQEFLSSFDSAGLTVTSQFEQRLDAICQRIHQIESSAGFQFANCWYLSNPQPIFNVVTIGTTYPRPGTLFPDTRVVIENALNRGDNSGLVHLEKGLLGFTYQGSFGVSSQDIHFSPCTFSNYLLDSLRFQRAITSINLLSAVIVCRCLLLTTAPPDGPAHALFDRIAGPANQPMYNAVVTPQAAQDDFLTARDINGNLLCGVILNIRPRANRFVLYEVRQIGPNPLPNQLVPATDVLHYFLRARMQDVINQLIAEQGGGQLPTLDLSFASAAQHQYNDLTRVANDLGGLRFGSLITPFIIQDPD